MGFIVDSNIFIAIERNAADPLSVIGEYTDESVAIAAVTAAELLHGVHRANNETRRTNRIAFVENLFASIPIIAYDLDVAREHGRLWAEMQQQGEVIGPHDMQIAATCLARGFSLATSNDREFLRVSGLKVVNWFAS